jgi:hypothetical protein
LELADCHLAKLDLGARFDAMLVNWSSKEEEEVYKSLRHFEVSTAAGAGLYCDRRGGSDCQWEDDDRAKRCIRCVHDAFCIVAFLEKLLGVQLIFLCLSKWCSF